MWEGSMENISVILVNYQSSQDTVHCVKSLLNQDYPHISIVVVDNSEEERYVNEIYTEIKKLSSNISMLNEKESDNFKNLKFNKDTVLIKAEENKGFSRGNNIGIKLSLKNNADYIWILNNDTEVSKNSLNEMLKVSKKYKSGVTTCKIKDFNNREIVQYNGEKIYYINVNREEADIIKIPSFISGSNLLIKSEVFQKTGLLDEDFFLYFEDNYFYYKVIKNKISCIYTPFTEIYHKGGSSIGRFMKTPLSMYYGIRNSFIILEKMEKLTDKNLKKALDNSITYFLHSQRDKKLLKAVLLGIYDFLKGKKGKQENLEYFLNLKPDKAKLELCSKDLETLHKKYPTNIYINQILAEKYKNNIEKRIDYVFYLALSNPRKKEYYTEFFKATEDLLNIKH
jgi:hypothetical protein